MTDNNAAGFALVLSDELLLKYYLMIVLLFVLILSIQMFATPLLVANLSKPIDELRTMTWTICDADPLDYLLRSIEIFIILIGSYFAWKTRKVRADFNESQSMSIALHNSLIFLVLAFAVQFIVEFVRSLMITLTIIISMCLPKLFMQQRSGPGTPTPHAKSSNNKANIVNAPPPPTQQPPSIHTATSKRKGSQMHVASHLSPTSSIHDSARLDRERMKEELAMLRIKELSAENEMLKRQMEELKEQIIAKGLGDVISIKPDPLTLRASSVINEMSPGLTGRKSQAGVIRSRSQNLPDYH
ncbi:hypothetical protein HK102_003154 [Quaeritorhiza haematococci]|nr:hypothetical protein HK102_003154 [Quaeritorhiza haematococci]